MIRSLVFGICLLAAAAPVSAQDLLVRRDSTRQEVRVLEITPDEVRYKRCSNPDGPTYVLPVGEIGYIRYANGETETLSPAAGAAGSVGSAAPAARQDAARTYAVGDYYDRDGVTGIVCLTDAEGRHGLVISLEEASLSWCGERKPGYLTGADDKTDGAANMETLARFIAREGLSWADFPAFDWCRSKGEGWYLPAVDEWLQISFLYNGGTRMHKDRSARNLFNDALTAAGGKKMDRMAYYFSSTEAARATAFLSHLALDPPYVVELPKHSRWLVRAVHRF